MNIFQKCLEMENWKTCAASCMWFENRFCTWSGRRTSVLKFVKNSYGFVGPPVEYVIKVHIITWWWLGENISWLMGSINLPQLDFRIVTGRWLPNLMYSGVWLCDTYWPLEWDIWTPYCPVLWELVSTVYIRFVPWSCANTRIPRHIETLSKTLTLWCLSLLQVVS